MITVKPPNKVPRSNDLVIFLAGSIEMGAAINWQKRVEDSLNGTDCVILNPRREDWNADWVQSIDHPEFAEQVTWEMDGIEASGLVMFYFEPGTKSPISLMELGWAAGLSKEIVVCCPNGFWRKGNVDIICMRHGILTVESLDELITYAKRYQSIVGTRGT
jgi:hypothetical protein